MALGNNRLVDSEAVSVVDLFEDIAAYDKLPLYYKRLLQQTPVDYSAQAVLELVEDGFNPKEIREAIRATLLAYLNDERN